MKRLLILLTPILIVVVLYGCSKDHEAPTYDVYKQLTSPEDVVAVYDASKDKIDITWTMADTSGVIDFMLAVSDSSDFDQGNVNLIPTNINLSKVDSPYSTTYDVATYIPADIDSTILYFTVSAVFDNDTFVRFIGPRAEIDSAVVLRK